MLKQIPWIGALALLSAEAALARDSNTAQASEPIVVTSSNAAANQLLFYSATGDLLGGVYTQGQGGVSNNAGGIAAANGLLAVANFGSGNVSVFAADDAGPLYHVQSLVQTGAGPVSVAFGNNHLYVLTTTHVESHAIRRRVVDALADGSAPLLKADGSAAQVGVMSGQLIVTEKSNAVETVALDPSGALVGGAVPVIDVPANVDTPFGLVTRGNSAYVTLAHADEISLVRKNAVVATTGSGSQHSPCWLALDGAYLFSANSPSHSVSRFAVIGQNIIPDEPVAATFGGNPTDIAFGSNLVAVVDSNGTDSHLSVFSVDDDGKLELRGAASIANNAHVNGAVIVTRGE